ncbi:AraC-type DNA-binding protein [Dyadobacter soli]|uniref:AraC-type DNA-binding protein n=1 Tax=Dyadobacter soli TaxID=659014 RepID=A0A1G7VJG1_9BACT|nr:helix-turn-helix domain-containing protein [Dyadobacter soli]SDG59982.1 AraC-type DNA-binding protein [Dyadobacter soli]
MSFVEYQPAPDLQDHIAAYWVANTAPNTAGAVSGRRVYADGCTDLICNAGQSTAYFYPMAGQGKRIALMPGQLYLGGTMTSYGVLTSEEGCVLTGIRFLPGGFYAWFGNGVAQAVDSVLEFPEQMLRAVMVDESSLEAKLNTWFLDKTTGQDKRACDFLLLRKLMYESQGQVSVQQLARQVNMSIRTLQRLFKKNVGIPPKDFLRIVRFQQVLTHLHAVAAQNDSSINVNESLLGIAFELGYYDHAHLTHEFKKYAGVLPSELSHFYKTRISAGQYF